MRPSIIDGARRVARCVARRVAPVGLAVLAGCEFDEKTIAPGRPRPVVHAVLNPFGGRDYVVLLERTLTGRVATTDSLFDPEDPIVTGGGEPITGAVVEIVGPNRTATGIEDISVRTDGKGRGVYRFVNTGCALGCPENAMFIARVTRYTLRVRLPDGTIVTGATTVPAPRFNPDTGATRRYDRERERYTFSWNPEVEATKRFSVQIQTPYGPFELFTAEPSIALAGDLRNPFIERIPFVFVPGFLQDLQVLAVDTNYFDYYRSANDPFTGSGLLTHLDGATGLFGSVVPVRRTQIDVIAPIDEPGEGTWEIEGDTAAFRARLTLYYSGDVASGRIEDPDETPFRRFFLGIRSGPRDASQLALRVLRAQTNGDTLYTIVGAVSGETLLLGRAGEPPRRWRRVATGAPAN